MATGPTPQIQDYGVIGDCLSTALVSRFGSVDWLCWPRFDSPSIFGALLDRDREKAGYWSIAPVQAAQVQRAYIPDSKVLETHFSCRGGRAMLTDLMPVASEAYKRENLVPAHELLRQIACTEGELEIAVAFRPRADYGCAPVKIRSNSYGLRMEVGRGAYWLRSSTPIKVDDDGAGAHAVIRLKRGEVLQFSLSYAEQSPTVLPALGRRATEAIQRSVTWWQQWAAKAKYEGPYREAVVRSALALKLLAYAPSGAIAAAATTSLPERVGDTLNWDYRYCWLRDASLTIRSLLGLGYREEAESFITWLLHATRLTQPELRILYTVFGQLAPKEQNIEQLSGYYDSRPVRVGNDARHQLQLDVYGEVIEASAQYAERHGKFDRTTQKVLIGLGKYVAHNWDQPDEGIWEPRSGRENNTYSRLLCWTALDRLLALDEKGFIKGVPRAEFKRERERIREQLETRGWNAKIQSYVSTLDGDSLDAALLRIPWYGFEEADCERMKSTYRKIREDLGAGDGLLYRYRREPPEGAFGICGFWCVEHLALGGGSLEEAHNLFGRLLRYANDLGLFSEEIDPATGAALGNFPQAFTHVGLISAALTLEEQERGKSHPAVHTGSDVKATPAGEHA
ncbi:MAG TPA: glycoside hydrolase family 15 protein [Candidatus Acidoferrales bacterium]|nr:glycoside hydrolase family 15 protein [Candidatus Acidoferrales bacterium]